MPPRTATVARAAAPVRPARAETAPAESMPGFAADLRLDVLAATSPALGATLFAPLPDPAAVADRQAAFRDLESSDLLAAATPPRGRNGEG